MSRFRRLSPVILLLTVFAPYALANLIPPDLLPKDPSSLLIPRFHRSEIVGFLAGLGTTFAALPDLIAMLKKRSSAGMNPRMAMIMGVFQILWVYYGLLIASRPVIAWNILAILINSLSVGAYRYFVHREQSHTPHSV
jgi:uncharacterized protein with PQ loop repeat